MPLRVAPLLAAGLVAAARAQPVPTAIFPFGLVDTSLQGALQGERPDERQRLSRLDDQLRQLLTASGCCLVRSARAGAPGKDWARCNGCELDAAREAGAEIAVTGWVQKVSNLILNINLVARDVATGRVIGAGSADIRGNTDEAWSRGLAYLLRDRLHPSDWR